MEIRAVGLTVSSHLCFYSSAAASAKPQRLPITPAPLSPLAAPRRPSTTKRTGSRAPHGISGARMSAVKLESYLSNKATEISSELKGTSIFLVGMNCTMKTNLGKLLSDILRYYYFDSDDLAKQAVGGKSAADPFQEKDEEGFRNSETEVLKQLSSMGRLVVCAGDGAVESSTNLAYLRYGISLWIDVPVDLISNEILKNDLTSPAALAPPDSESFTEVLQELVDRYNKMKEGYETADATISLQKLATQLGYENLDSVTPEDMAVQVFKEIEKLTRAKKMMEAAARPF